MDVVQIRTLAIPGRPTAVGKVGMVVVTPQESGEILCELTISRRGARYLGLTNPPKLDKRRRKKL